MGTQVNATCGHPELSKQQDTFLTNCRWWVEICGNLPVGVVGVILNCITLIVLSSPTMRTNFFNRILICLAFFDNCYLLCEISEVFRHRYYTYLQQHVFVSFVYPFRSIFMCSSMYMTVSLTLERYRAITSPMEYRLRGTTAMGKRLLYYVMPVMTFSFIYYTPKFLDLNVNEVVKCYN